MWTGPIAKLFGECKREPPLLIILADVIDADTSEFRVVKSALTPTAPATTTDSPGANFGQMILDDLRKAGVKGTDKGQRITFARLDNFPGENI